LNVRLQPRQNSFSEADLNAISDQIIRTAAKNCDAVLRG